MDFKGRYFIPSDTDAVWIALHNPDVLASSIPGCERVEKLSDSEYRAKALLKIGPIKAVFEGLVTLTPMPPPQGFSHALTLKGEGQGGPAGFAKGESQVRLRKDGAGTVLEYDAKASVGGRLAQLGQRLIDGVAKSMADAFFAKFVSLMEGTAAVAPDAKTPAPPSPPETGLAPQIWVAGLVAIVILMLVLFGIVL